MSLNRQFSIHVCGPPAAGLMASRASFAKVPSEHHQMLDTYGYIYFFGRVEDSPDRNCFGSDTAGLGLRSRAAN